jgi:cyclophilin family peptidyl-prolyl cis-trans isomerase
MSGPIQPLDSMKTPRRATLVALPGQPIPAPSAKPTPASVPVETSAPPVAAESMPAPSTGASPSAAVDLPAESTPPALSSESGAAPPPAALSSEMTSDSPGAVGASVPAPSPPSAENMEAAENSEVAVIQTSMGKIVIELDDFAAPKTCKNFRQLISDGFYNNTVFHRVIPDFIIQGGDPKSKTSAADRNTYGLGSPGYTIAPEIALKHDRGAVGMARLPDALNPRRESNGSQFYICLAPCPTLDDQYTVFGHVIRGLDVAEKIAAQPRDARDNPLQRIEMTVNLEPKDQAVANATTVNP